MQICQNEQLEDILDFDSNDCFENHNRQKIWKIALEKPILYSKRQKDCPLIDSIYHKQLADKWSIIWQTFEIKWRQLVSCKKFNAMIFSIYLIIQLLYRLILKSKVPMMLFYGK